MRTNYWKAKAAREYSLSRRKMLTASGTAGLGLGALGLVGCGGDDDDEPGGSTPASSGTTAGGTATGGTTAAGETPSSSGPPIPAVAAEQFYSPWSLFPREYDGHTALGPNIWHIIGNRAIRRHAKTGDLLPELAASWEQVDPEGLEMTIKIQPDIKTHEKAPTNGRTFTAEDFAYNLVRITGALDPDNKARYQRAATLAGLDTATAVDATTVQVKMTKPNSGFFAGLAEFRNLFMPKDTIEGGFANPAALSGTGPFVVREFEDYKVAKFDMHPNFFVKGQPHFKTLEMQPTNDRSAQVSAFLAKQLVYIAGITAAERPIFDGQRKDARMEQHSGLNWYHIRFNTQKKPYDDPRVRQAISMVIDREALAKARHGDAEWALTGPIVPGFPEALTHEELKSAYPWFDSAKRDANITEARALLSAAGVGDLEVGMLPGSQTTTAEWFENAVRSKDQIEQALPNLKVTVTPPADTAAFAQLQSRGEFDIISYTITTLPDQALELNSQFHSTGSRNYGKFNDPEADTLLDKALSTIDPQARSEVIKEIQDKILKDWHPVAHFYVNPDVRYVDPNYHLEDNEEQLGTWNPSGVGYGGQYLRYWYKQA